MKKCNYLLFMLFMAYAFIACARVGGSNHTVYTDTTTIAVNTTVTQPTISVNPNELKPTQTLHVFIENSGSMNGYINSSSDFQMAIGRAIQLMKFKYGEGNIKTYYINTKIFK